MRQIQKTSHKAFVHTSVNNERYVVNLASLASPALHREASAIVLKSVDQLAWINVLHDGLGVWCSAIEKKGKSKVKKKNIGALTSTMDPELV
ncbi:hypothetical protein PSTG_12332 [Puccinia striiformis f. sp. tritici PST-78]|uniref:Uncharacterized protein n=1 Tax=Puccinia striiformis f. sp. tritici PST-78 TaxID=1165861 RepID=A0A0L0V4U8_9BASI|nr:hypothetical protein PSTG_12332 [Puccinia striiformis f. sp. tritici PST-78]